MSTEVQNTEFLNVKEEDKNIVWEVCKFICELWAMTIDTSTITEEMIKKFKKKLLAYLLVEHDEVDGKIKLFKETDSGAYTLLRKSLDHAGIPVGKVSNEIRRMTLYPSGHIKVEWESKNKEWISRAELGNFIGSNHPINYKVLK